MTALRDIARAKVNLTLEVLGRRPDGYHELLSLVAFAELGDTIELQPGDGLALTVEGPFADALEGDNLVIQAARAAKAMRPSITLGSFRLIKALPVAAGLGGGSADAAAALRLLLRANSAALDPADLAEIAAGLGSDVTVCVESRPALISGRGESLTAVQGMPACGLLLVNPGRPLATASVYGALDAPPLPHERPRENKALDFARSFEQLIDCASARGNDLEQAAKGLLPVIDEVFDALRGIQGARLVRLSGSGPTCFALFSDPEEAERAARLLAAPYPAWWVVASTLGPS